MVIYNSYDYGKTWSPSKQNFQLNWYYICMNNSGKIQSAVAQNEYIYNSYDYGQTWAPNMTTSNENNWTSICMSETGEHQTAVVNGYYNNVNEGFIWGSHDYGINWNTSYKYNNSWLCVAMSNNGQIQTAVSFYIDDLVENNEKMGYVFNSYDYGNSWQKNTSLNFSYYTSVGMSGNGKLQVVCVNNCNAAPAIPGPIHISYDYGSTFTKTTCPYDNWLNISMNNIGSIILVSSYQQTDSQNNIVPNTGKKMVSYDYGKTWVNACSNLSTWTSSIISKQSCVASSTAWGHGIFINNK
jgi:photosystem II stability/assembly factor-like uncharacterized protein